MSESLMNKFLSGGGIDFNNSSRKPQTKRIITPDETSEKSRSKLAENISKNFFPSSPRKNSNASAYSNAKAMELENKIKDLQSGQNEKEDVLKMIKERIKQQKKVTGKDYDDESEEEEIYPPGVSRSYQQKNLNYYMNKYRSLDSEGKKEKRRNRRRKSYDESDEDEDYRKDREKRKMYMYEQQRDLDELRQDIDVEIRRIMRTNKIEDLQDVMQEIDDIKYQLRKERNDLKKSNNPEFLKLLDSIVTLKNDIDKKLSEGSNDNNKRLNILRDEFKGFKDDINDKIGTLEKKQIQQLFGLKYILENDPYIKNKEKIQYIFNNIEHDKNSQSKKNINDVELNKAIYDLDYKKDLKKPQNSNRTNTSARPIINNLPRETNNKKDDTSPTDLNDNIKNPKHINLNPNKQINTPIPELNIPKNSGRKVILKKKQKLRSNILAVLWYLRIKLILQRAKKKLSQESLKYFAANYENIDNLFRLFVYNTMKKAYQSIANNDLLKIDFTEKIGPFTKNKEDILKKKLESSVGCISEVLKALDEIANLDKIKKNYLEYLLNLISNNSYVPKKFFSYFELLRLEFITGKVLTNITKQQQLMILTIFILGKIILKDIFIEDKFIKSSFKSAKGTR